MTEELYIRFVALLAAAMLVPAIVFLAMAINHPKWVYWRFLSLGCTSLFAASLLSALREVLPPVSSTIVSNLLVGLGYFLSAKAVRSLQGRLVRSATDNALLISYSAAVVIVNVGGSIYEYRASLVSLIILAFSAIVFCQIYRTRALFSKLGSAVIMVACVVNVFLASARAAAALAASEKPLLSISLWDPIFFIGSIGTLFAFSIGYFIIGSSLLTAETEQLLENERVLSDKLAMAIEDQKNLQKLLLHELKRPINAIQAALQAENDSPARNIQANESRRKLRRHITEASTLLEGIGEYDELSALFQNPNKTMVGTKVIAEDIRLKWRIHVDVQDQLSEVYADRFLIDIALGNLVENANKFGKTEEGTSITVSGNPRFVTWDVKDDGSGIPRSEWTKVWGKFYRVGLPSENALRGCGLGLHAVKSIAEAHGGYAEVVSQAPSIVRFALPKAAQGASDARQH